MEFSVDHLSKPFAVLTIPLILKYLDQYRGIFTKLPNVSVGCGTMIFETSVLLKHFPEINIIGVDPAPDSYSGPDEQRLGRNVDFATVPDLLRKLPDVQTNCILWLVWPEPDKSPGMEEILMTMIASMMGRQHKIPSVAQTKYAFEAIKTLEPNVIVTVSDITGGSGGDLFNCFLALIGIPAFTMGSDLDKQTTESVRVLACQYRIIAYIARGSNSTASDIATLSDAVGLPGSENVHCLIILAKKGFHDDIPQCMDVQFSDTFPKKWISKYSKCLNI